MPMDDGDLWDPDETDAEAGGEWVTLGATQSGCRWDPSDADLAEFEEWARRSAPDRADVYQQSRSRMPEEAIKAIHTVRRPWERNPTDGTEQYGTNCDNVWAITRWPNPDYL